MVVTGYGHLIDCVVFFGPFLLGWGLRKLFTPRISALGVGFTIAGIASCFAEQSRMLHNQYIQRPMTIVYGAVLLVVAVLCFWEAAKKGGPARHSRKTGFLIVLLVTAMSGCRNEEHLENVMSQALSNALRPQASPSVTHSALADLANNQDRDLLTSRLGDKNLTVFLLTLHEGIPLFETDLYEWSWDTPHTSLLGSRLASELTAVTLADLKDLTWKRSASGVVRGSFTLDLDYGLKGRFVFDLDVGARRITRLVVANRKSDDIEKGFLVFER